MSSTKKSASRSIPKYSLDDVDCVITSQKKPSSPSTAMPRSAHTRSKSIAHKRKRAPEPDDEFDIVEKSVQDVLSEQIVGLRRLLDEKVKEKEESLTAAAKATVEDLEKAHAKQIKAIESQHKAALQKAEEDSLQDAKLWTARFVIQARLKMAEEAEDPGFDRSSWDVAAWKQKLLELGEEEADEDQAGGSGLNKEADVAMVGEEGAEGDGKE